MELRCYNYKLKPSEIQVGKIEECLTLHRQLWNAAIQQRQEAWKKQGASVNYSRQSKEFTSMNKEVVEYQLFPCASFHQTLKRLDVAVRASFSKLKKGKSKYLEFPRYKNSHHFSSFGCQYGNGVVVREGFLRVKGIGNIKIILHRPLPEGCKIKNVVVRRECNGYFVSLQVEGCFIREEKSNGDPIGIDLGLSTRMMKSNGESIDVPRFLRNNEDKVKRLQRSLSRKKKGSAGYKKARQLLANAKGKEAAARKDFLHNSTRQISKEHRVVCLENLNVKGMIAKSKREMRKSFADAALGVIPQMLDYKTKEHGGELRLVDPKNTTQMCSQCGAIPDVKKTLWDKVHKCECGCEMDRDHNAAINILNRGMAQ